MDDEERDNLLWFDWIWIRKRAVENWNSYWSEVSRLEFPSDNRSRHRHPPCRRTSTWTRIWSLSIFPPSTRNPSTQFELNRPVNSDLWRTQEVDWSITSSHRTDITVFFFFFFYFGNHSLKFKNLITLVLKEL